ncbi:preprotein translocase subunit YajC [Kineococcus glutinatus]|uniref:Preprotein translocase subunit YajC n=1 Tax=Kineococcus glutinatus TaxID=1070872 RepID=A0ABP9HSK1_9ACTN
MDGSLVFLLLMVGLLVFTFSRTRKQQRAQAQLLDSVGPGAEVMTTSGMFARVVDVDGDVVHLELAPGTVTRWNRRAVARIITPATGPDPDAAAPGRSGAAPAPEGTAGPLSLHKDGPGAGPAAGGDDRPRA